MSGVVRPKVFSSEDRSPASSGLGLIRRDHQGTEISGEKVLIGMTLGFMSYSAFSSQVDPGLDQVGIGGFARCRRDERRVVRAVARRVILRVTAGAGQLQRGGQVTVSGIREALIDRESETDPEPATPLVNRPVATCDRERV